MVRMFRVMCAWSITPKVTMTLTGMEAATMSELRTWRRKNSSTRKVMPTPIRAVDDRLPSEALM